MKVQMKKFRAAAVLGGLAAVAMVGAQAQNLILNGDFESPNMAPFGIASATWTPPSTVGDGGGWLIEYGTFGVYNHLHQSYKPLAGNQSGFFNTAGTSISQNFDSISGAAYTVGFTLGALPGFQASSYAVGVNIQDTVTGDYILTKHAMGSSLAMPGGGDSFLYSFAGTGNPLKLSFVSLDPYVAIDSVTVVPEPEVYALAAGLGLLAFAGYRRFRKS